MCEGSNPTGKKANPIRGAPLPFAFVSRPEPWGAQGRAAPRAAAGPRGGRQLRSAPRTSPLSTVDSSPSAPRSAPHQHRGQRPAPAAPGAQLRRGDRLVAVPNPLGPQRWGVPSPHFARKTQTESPMRRERARLRLGWQETLCSACRRSFGACLLRLECREGEMDEEVQHSL